MSKLLHISMFRFGGFSAAISYSLLSMHWDSSSPSYSATPTLIYWSCIHYPLLPHSLKGDTARNQRWLCLSFSLIPVIPFPPPHTLKSHLRGYRRGPLATVGEFKLLAEE